jgi:cellulose synthase/poly-beta-1,6-N-acetylglucosamine synthase-like glycosyltransferase
MHKQLAKAPSQPVASERIFRWWDYVVFIPLSACALVAMASFMSYWFSLEDWLDDPVPIGLVTIVLVYNLSLHQLRWFSLLLMRRPKPMQARQGWKVAVVTTFVPEAEPFEMLAETLRALVAMRYPHDTWVLDEGDDEQVKALCTQLGARHFSRRQLSHYHAERGIFQSRSKHGNYNTWLYEVGFAQYDIVSNFDPDHVPDPAYLVNVLGYFTDPAIGYVQAPQVYYNQGASFIARGAAEETYEYYSVSQMASYAMGFPIVTGRHTTHRMTALRQVAGFAPHDGDDLLLTYLYRASGWKGVYVPKVLAHGLTPVDWSVYLTQQLRWARSLLDIKFRVCPKLMRLFPLKVRVCSVLHGLYYLQGLTTLVGVLLLAFMLSTGFVPQFVSAATISKLLVLYAVMQLSDFYKQRFFLGRSGERGLHWRAGLLRLAKWPYLVLALIDVVLDRQHPYYVTRKVKTPSRQYMVVWPHLAVVVLISSSWIIGLLCAHDCQGVVHVWASLAVVLSLAIMWTETGTFPAPYDKRLRDRQL